MKPLVRFLQVSTHGQRGKISIYQLIWGTHKNLFYTYTEKGEEKIQVFATILALFTYISTGVESTVILKDSKETEAFFNNIRPFPRVIGMEGKYAPLNSQLGTSYIVPKALEITDVSVEPSIFGTEK